MWFSKLKNNLPIYLALGDSMSIDFYTGVRGGGAVNKFYKSLKGKWKLDDRTYDGCSMSGVPRNKKGNIITLTIGGNDLLYRMEEYLSNLEKGIKEFEQEHLDLLNEIRSNNPDSLFIVGDIYNPQEQLPQIAKKGLNAANQMIEKNCKKVGAHLAKIHSTFLGHENEYLCLNIEPTLKGATAISNLFKEIYERELIAKQS